VLTTCAAEDEAERLGTQLVKKQLAACAQIHRIHSIYSWKGQIHKDPEFRLMIKTRDDLYHQVETFIRETHEYELPQIVRLPLDGGLPQYLEWIDENTL